MTDPIDGHAALVARMHLLVSDVPVEARLSRCNGRGVLSIRQAQSDAPAKIDVSTRRRAVAAVNWLLTNDAAVVHKVRRMDAGPLEWNFNCAPGHERDHDRVLRRVLPLLLPRRIDDSLYKYQRRGVRFLMRSDRAVLADDMGLGKTVQVIAAVRRLYRAGRLDSCLVAAPRTLLANWAQEFRRWAPELAICELDRCGGKFSGMHWRSLVTRSHAVLASHEDVRDLWEHMACKLPGLIVADEAHRLRKADSQLSKAMRRLRAERLWMLTGTPVERDAADLACLLSLLAPNLYAIDDHLHFGTDVLRARARPYLLRRTKEGVLPELPRAREHRVLCELLPEQRVAYEEAVQRALRAADPRHLAVFNNLLRVCDADPATGKSSKIDRAVELVKRAAVSGRKTVVFSYTLDPLRYLRERLWRSSTGCLLLNGEQSKMERGRVIQNFMEDPDCIALAASLQVGSEGLNLTVASQVVFLNRWWNPSTNDQAVDRVVRIGQVHEVDVHYLTCVDTVEDRLEPMLERKSMTYQELIDKLKRDPDPATVSELFGSKPEVTSASCGMQQVGLMPQPETA
ncbi:DEAD/DEAH box helicase [Candidatus Poriferisodalis sp.]|uniref:DEAD/DEAH box helicase n=1 Tax=Candidatus Poriferisodalis sp. TaxID=3101277 RepID=UPI003B018769